MEHFKIELKLEDLKSRVESMLEAEIKKHFNDSNINSVLSENIHSIFKTSWNDSRGSKLRQIIDDSIDNHVRNCIYTVLEKTEIKLSIETAVENCLKDSVFVNELAKAKVMDILTKKQ